MIPCDQHMQMVLFWDGQNLQTNNLGHNIMELYNVLVQIRLTTSKTKRDI